MTEQRAFSDLQSTAASSSCATSRTTQPAPSRCYGIGSPGEAHLDAAGARGLGVGAQLWVRSCGCAAAGVQVLASTAGVGGGWGAAAHTMQASSDAAVREQLAGAWLCSCWRGRVRAAEGRGAGRGAG
jgi:hypothetical protein